MSGPVSLPPVPGRLSPEDDRIRNGLLRHVREAVASHRPLPGELDLAAALGCSRQQVRHALSQLDHLGVVRRRQGAATTVDPVGLRLSVRLEEQFEHTELLARLGYEAAVEVLEQNTVAVDAHIASLLEVEAGSAAAHVVKRWTADGAPAMVASDTLLLPAGSTGIPVDSVFTAVQTLWNEAVMWEVATPGVVTLDAPTAELLALPEGSPALTFETIGVAVSGRRLFHSLEYHHPSLISYSVVRTVRPPW